MYNDKAINDYVINDTLQTQALYKRLRSNKRVNRICDTLGYVIVACAILAIIAVVYFRPFLLWLILVLTTFGNLGITTYLLFQLKGGRNNE